MNIHFQKDYSRLGWSVYCYQKTNTDKRIPFKISIEPCEALQNGFQMNPSITIDDEKYPDFIDALVKGLSEAGILQKSPEAIGELSALKKHVEDLQRLLFESEIKISRSQRV